MSHDFTCIWNIKHKINAQQNPNRLGDTENILMVARWEEDGGWEKKVKD